MPHSRDRRNWWLREAYRGEVEFYRNFAHSVGVRVPKHIYSEFDPETCDYILVIEDFPDSKNVRDETGATSEQTDMLLEYMARLHSANWMSPARKVKTVLIERKLSVGGGMWGGGMMFPRIVVQDEAKRLLDRFSSPI